MPSNLFRKVIVPLVHGCDSSASLRVARALAVGRDILLVGLVMVKTDESLSVGALPARELRRQMRELREQIGVRSNQQIRVSNRPWDELIGIAREEDPDLLIIEECHASMLGVDMQDALRTSPCSTAILSGQVPEKIGSLLVAQRGGPSAELSLRIGLSIAGSEGSGMTTLHIVGSKAPPKQDISYQGIASVLKHLPAVRRMEMVTDEPASAILEAARDCDLLIMGSTVRPHAEKVGIGPIAESILQERHKGTLIVKIISSSAGDSEGTLSSRSAISVLVDKWFAEHTYHAEEFADLEALVRRKEKQNLKVSLALPALNEEETVGDVIRVVKSALMDRLPVLDEIVLMDSNSTDRTRQIAADLGVPVYIHQELLPQYGSRRGKGEALWKSLYVTHGDILLWIDTDIVNIGPAFVFGLLGPLLLDPRVQFIKGYYQRPLKVDGKMQAGGGGRVTELTARPLLNLFYPELSGIIQPLSGEYGGRRSALEQMAFSSGYGVEIGLLIDIFEKYGLGGLAQVDLSERIHHNQPLESLSKMSFAIIQTLVRRLEHRYRTNILEDVNKTMKLIRYAQGSLFLEVSEIAELERPPMCDLPEYRAKFASG